MKWIFFIITAAIIYSIFKMFRGSIKHSAVQNAFLAKVTLSKLNDQEKEHVKNKSIEILIRGGMNNDYALKFFNELSEIYRFSIMALAMAELNIRPALPSEMWHYVKRPFEPLEDVRHQIEVVKHHFMKYHNVNVDFD